METIWKKIRSLRTGQQAALLVGVIALLVSVCCFTDMKSAPDPPLSGVSQESRASEYETETQKQLEVILSQIAGAGEVAVYITFESGGEAIPATNANYRTNEDADRGATVDESLQIVTVQQNGTTGPIILKELNPKATGAVIVAEGADELSVRLDLAEAACAALGINETQIAIFDMKGSNTVEQSH